MSVGSAQLRRVGESQREPFKDGSKRKPPHPKPNVKGSVGPDLGQVRQEPIKDGIVDGSQPHLNRQMPMCGGGSSNRGEPNETPGSLMPKREGIGMHLEPPET